MSTDPIEVAEEALQKLDELNIVDQESKDKTETKTETSRRVRLTDEERRKVWEEKQAKKRVLEEGIKGKVKWYSVRGKYGFIARKDGKNDVFVHQSAIAKSSIVRYFLRTLADEEEVEFDVVEGDKGPEAANVTGPEGAEVLGSRNYHILIRRRVPLRQSRPEGDKKNTSKTEEEGKDEEKKRKPKRPNRYRRNRKTDKKSEEETNDEKDANEIQEKPARRRVSNEENDAPKKGKINQTKTEPLKGSGDASLGALSCESALVN